LTVLQPSPAGPALSAYFAGPYLQGEVHDPQQGAEYTAAVEEIIEHSLERHVTVFEHRATGIRVWAEALDLRSARPGCRTEVLYHYTTREGFSTFLDHRQPVQEALKSLCYGEPLSMRASSREPNQLRSIHTHGAFSIPVLVPASCCEQAPDEPENYLLSFSVGDLQRVAMLGWTCLRPKLLDRPWAQKPGELREGYWHCLGEFGAGLLLAGHTPHALQACQQAARGSASQLGALHADSLRLRHNLAAASLVVGAAADAEQNFKAAWEGRCRTLGRSHPATARSITELANVVSGDARRRKEAQAWYRKALEAKQACYGASHPEAASCMIALAYSLWQDGSRDEAEDFYKRALLISESTLGPEHETTLHCLTNLAAIAKELGRKGELDRLLGRRPGEKCTKPIGR